jgi:hypothetical protein
LRRSTNYPNQTARCSSRAPRGGYIDLHNFRARSWRPAQVAAGIEPIRRPYDLRHTYATFALRAGISIFDLSRFMGASLAMIDKHYGHLARDGREHAVALLDAYARDAAAWTLNGRRTTHRQSAQGQCATVETPTFGAVDVSWTPLLRNVASSANRSGPCAGGLSKPSDGLEPSTPSLPFRGVTRVHARSSATRFLLQIGFCRRRRCVARRRGCRF